MNYLSFAWDELSSSGPSSSSERRGATSTAKVAEMHTKLRTAAEAIMDQIDLDSLDLVALVESLRIKPEDDLEATEEEGEWESDEEGPESPSCR